MAEGAGRDAGADRTGVDREDPVETVVIGKRQEARAGLGEVTARAAGDRASEGDI